VKQRGREIGLSPRGYPARTEKEEEKFKDLLRREKRGAGEGEEEEEEEEGEELIKDLKRHARLAVAWDRHGSLDPGGPDPLCAGQDPYSLSSAVQVYSTMLIGRARISSGLQAS